MKATRGTLLSLTTVSLLCLPHGSLATTSGSGYDGETSQLTLQSPNTRLRLTSEHEYEYGPAQDGTATNLHPLEALQDALEVMQSNWFELWVGTWPTAIDWTAAVVDTHLVATLSTLSKALESKHGALDEYRVAENDLNRYFSQNVAYYYNEDAFSIRNQAYDDMLWVVLGWLESIKFIHSHSSRHYNNNNESNNHTSQWQGAQFISSFAHRARIFYDLASSGWDETLCGGGMVWSPYLTPYKNAITNELFIAASVRMYLYFPGDNNTSPFLSSSSVSGTGEPHDPAYLHAAIKGYDWLKKSHMRNDRGLYTDGFHISRWRDGGTKCDVRNDMVFTYNQGVVLSALRGLWESTGNVTYLTDAHQLVRDVISATGWDIDSQRPRQDRRNWHGLGRAGILEERCDSAARCSQDSQTFKGIFFHHLTLLCEALPLEAAVPGKTFGASREVAALHKRSCGSHAVWTAHNARAVVKTRDAEGRFGGWWGAGLDEVVMETPPYENGAVDYRSDNEVLKNPLWQLEEAGVPFGLHGSELADCAPACEKGRTKEPHRDSRDSNDRGRGRTVETQTGGIAVLRALWELTHLD